MDEVLRSGSDSFSPASPTTSGGYGSTPTPRGFAGRFHPPDLVGYWMDVVALSADRTGLLIGCRPTEADANGHAQRVHAVARAELLRTADPVQTLSTVRDLPWSALCAVVDGDTIAFSGQGHPGAAISCPGRPTTVLDSMVGRLVVSPLEPGATVLISTGPVTSAATLLADCGSVHPEQLADRIILGLNGSGGTAAVLYRHPPEPLSVTTPAEPSTLAVSRSRLRDWLNVAGVDEEDCADLLLAVGEATANATEHAVVGTSDPVHVTVDARFAGDDLWIMVSDNGSWRPASVSSGHRGHGIHLMNALVDSVELAPGPRGTTVTMVKRMGR